MDMTDNNQTYKPAGGFTQVENTILEALCSTGFRGEELRVILLIIRMTCGYHRKLSIIPLSYIVRATKISKRSVERALKGLLDKKMIEKVRSSRGNQYCVTAPSLWVISAHEQTIPMVQKHILHEGRKDLPQGSRGINKGEIKQHKKTLLSEGLDMEGLTEIPSMSQTTKSGSVRSQTLMDLEVLKWTTKSTHG